MVTKNRKDKELEDLFKKLWSIKSKTFEGMTTREILDYIRTHDY